MGITAAKNQNRSQTEGGRGKSPNGCVADDNGVTKEPAWREVEKRGSVCPPWPSNSRLEKKFGRRSSKRLAKSHLGKGPQPVDTVPEQCGKETGRVLKRTKEWEKKKGLWIA